MADDKVQQLRAQMHEDAKSGIITLKTPLRAGGRDVTELAYDFGKLTAGNMRTPWIWTRARATFTESRASRRSACSPWRRAKPTRAWTRRIFANGWAWKTPRPARGAGHGFSDHFDTGGKTQFLKRIVDASLATRTPVDTFMGMTLARFYDFAEAIAQVLKEMRSKG